MNASDEIKIGLQNFYEIFIKHFESQKFELKNFIHSTLIVGGKNYKINDIGMESHSFEILK